MRWYSTRESARSEQPSILAIAETLGAMAASVGIGWLTGSWWHLAIGASLAPLMLLRTDDSCARAFRWLDAYMGRISNWAESLSGNDRSWKNFAWEAGAAFLCYTTVAPVGAVFRVWATVVTTLQHPVSVAHTIPQNWMRTVLVTDSCLSPEFMPSPEDESRLNTIHLEPQRMLVYSLVRGFFPGILEQESLRERVAFALIVLPIIVVMTLSAFAYRWSLKSTAIVWLPIIWALKPARHDEPAEKYVRLFLRSDLVRFVIAFSFFELVLFSVKYIAFVCQHRLAVSADAWEPLLGERLAAFFNAFARPGEIPLWQVAATINAVLAIVAWLMARSFRNCADVGLPVDANKIDRTMGRILQVRRLFTSYAIACNLYAAYHLAKNLPVPQIGWKLFPWL